MAKISTFVIGILLASLFTVTMSQFYAGLTISYSGSYENDTIDLSNKFESVNTLGEETRTDLVGVTAQDSISDILGSYFSAGYRVLKVLGTSFDISSDLISSGSENVGLSTSFSDISKLIVLFTIFVGVVLAALLKWPV